MRSAALSGAGRTVHLKLECELPTGSFKVRGAVFALAARATTAKLSEVVAASTGNHGAAVAYAGRLLQMPVTIFLPPDANRVKVSRIRNLGARIIEAGPDLSAAIDAAYEYAGHGNAFFLHDATDSDIPAGTGTIGVELLAQEPSLDVIYVPMGDTALIRGVATAAKQIRPSIQLVGVVAAGAPAYCLSWAKHAPVLTPSAETIADGLAVTRPLAGNVAEICRLVDRVVMVADDAMLSAINLLAARDGVVAEPAGAAAVAALAQDDAPTGTFALLITGGNVTPEVYRAARRNAVGRTMPNMEHR